MKNGPRLDYDIDYDYDAWKDFPQEKQTQVRLSPGKKKVPG